MRDYVIINGVNSLTINGLAISKLPPISKPLMRNMREEIDGRDGDIITELGYSAYDKAMEIGLYGNFDINEVISFFNGEGTITFSNEDDKYYYFKILEQIDYEKLLKFKTATITFHCQPFKYPNNEQIIDVDSLTVEGTGTDITLANTSLYAPISTELLGDTIQDGTPTPDAPINVDTVNGRQEINVINRNLIDVGTSNSDYVNAGNSGHPSWLSVDDKTVSVVIQGADGTIAYRNQNFIGNSTFTISSNFSMNYGRYYIRLRNNDDSGWLTDSDISIDGFTYNPSYRGWFIIVQNTTHASTTVVIPPCLYWQLGVGYSSSNVGTIQTISNLQLEKGTTATRYEEFKKQSYEINLGKNLLDIETNINVNTGSGLTLTYNNDGSFNMKGTTTRTYGYITSYYNVNIQPGTYTLSIKQALTYRIYLNLTYFDDTTGSIIITTGNTSQTNTITKAIKKIQIAVSNMTNSTYYDETIYIMLEKGNQATSYALYKNPIELCKIGDYQDSIKKGNGKNLFGFNITAFDKTTTYRVNVNQRLAIEGTDNPNECKFTFGSGSYCRGYFEIEGINGLLPYSISFNVKENTTSFIPSYTIETSSCNENRLVFYINGGNGSTLASTSDYFILTNIQVELGNQSTTFEPYGTNGKWLLHKEIERINITSSMTWYKSGTTSVDKYYTRVENWDATLNKFSYCNRFVYKNNGVSVGEFDYSQNGTYLALFFCYATYNTSTINSFKSWLDSNEVYCYVPISTPTTTEITDTELLAQLNLLSNATTYDEATNILSTGDLPSILNVSATSIPTTTITNIGNIYAKPLLTIKGRGDISVYLNGIQLLQIALGDREEITIDVSKMEAYDEATNVLLNRLVIGDYSKFLINSGVNELLITGDVSNFTMSNYTRWL